MSPQVTAVIPLHNHVAWVVDAVKSVISQDYDQLRLVVVDDGSTDHSHLEVLGLLKDVRAANLQWIGTAEGRTVMVMRAPLAQGPAAARNLGIKAAWNGTEIFALLDSDDVYVSTKISKSAERFSQSESIGVVYSDYTTFRNDGLRVREYKPAYSRELLLRECVVNCNSLVSKAAFEKCGLFDESMRVCEDFDAWIRISEHFILSHIPESLVNIRVGPHSSTANVKSDLWQACYARVFEKLRQRSGAK